ncbi:MAG: srkA [Chthonomonadales bacterium]|nr:srkA [Chthonomonadales bacterium]
MEEPTIIAARSPGTPSAELEIDAALVRTLLAEQHPDLADLPLRLVETGWDNVMLRLGDELAVRLPRRALAATLIEHEQRWLSELAPNLPLPVPVPLRIGLPGAGYPWRWSVLHWLEGTAADLALPDADQGPALAEFLRALHTPAPVNAPPNPFRGIPLQERVSAISERLERVALRTDCITPAVRVCWEQALSAQLDTDPTWLHGDLHSRNVLVQDGAISAVIDWGDMTRGDRATDLAAIWNLLPDATARIAAIQAYGPTPEATWQRARGWAVAFGVMLLDSGLVNDPRLAAAGETTLRRITEGP